VVCGYGVWQAGLGGYLLPGFVQGLANIKFVSLVSIVISPTNQKYWFRGKMLIFKHLWQEMASYADRAAISFHMSI
jgi:hypothetical protein